jgi:hypothetical protein
VHDLAGVDGLLAEQVLPGQHADSGFSRRSSQPTAPPVLPPIALIPRSSDTSAQACETW